MANVVLLFGIILVPTALLPLWRADHWWVRIWDFPRLQLLALYLAAIGLLAAFGPPGWAAPTVVGLLTLCALYQLTWVHPYLPVSPVETRMAAAPDTGRRVRLVIVNVRMTNRSADRLLEIVRRADPDILIVDEADAWWAERLAPLEKTHPYRAGCPLDNTYGKILYSRLPLLETAVRFVVEPGVPSVRTLVRLRSGDLIQVISVHPRPPRPRTDTEARDAELVLTGREARASRQPTIVAGDMNDVGWSATSRLFQKVGAMLDPRRGRGLYGTYHASYPLLRFPLDHVFHTAEFRLVRMATLARFGSDHLPLLCELSYEPRGEPAQSPPGPGPGDRTAAEEVVRKAKRPAPPADERTRPAAPRGGKERQRSPSRRRAFS